MFEVQKMWCIRELDPFFVCFHLFGLTAYIPSKAIHAKRLLFSSVFFKFIQLAVAFAFVVLSFSNVLQDQSLWKLPDFNSFLQRYINMHFFLLVNFVLLKSTIAPHLSRRVCEHFCRVIEDMQFYLQIRLQMKTYKKTFVQKVALNLLPLLLQLVFDPHFFSPLHARFYIVILMVTLFVVLHVILFIDLISLCLYSINTKLKEHLYFKQPYIRVILIFRYLKWTHYNLCKISEILNENFGLLFVIISLHYFMWMVLNGYFIFVNLLNSQFDRLIGK